MYRPRSYKSVLLGQMIQLKIDFYCNSRKTIKRRKVQLQNCDTKRCSCRKMDWNVFWIVVNAGVTLHLLKFERI